MLEHVAGILFLSGNMKIKTIRIFSQVGNLEYQDISNKEIGYLVIFREARQTLKLSWKPDQIIITCMKSLDKRVKFY